MPKNKQTVIVTTLLISTFVWLQLALPAWADGPFDEPNVRIHRTFEGENIGDGFGWVGANVGDLNGDGLAEAVVTAPFFGADGSSKGKTYVYSVCDGVALNEVTGNDGELMGLSTASIGDANRDGVNDYVIGAPGGSRAVVYSGATHSEILTVSGNGSDFFGASVGGAGDVNADGIGDLIIGATQESSIITNTGKIYLVSGQDGTVLWTHEGDTENGFLGSGVGGLGDINGDGIPDQVAAAHGGNEGRGQAYVYSGVDGTILFTLDPTEPSGTPPTFGRFFARGAGDVNGDGVSDIFIGDYNAQRGEANGTGRAYIFSGVDGSVIQVYEAEADGDGFGVGRPIPDLDGDGLADLMLAAWTSSASVTGGGKVYLHSGADGALLQTITGNIENDALGVDALGLGDVSGDGLPDYLVTSTGNDFNGTDIGRAYVVSFGGAPCGHTMLDWFVGFLSGVRL